MNEKMNINYTCEYCKKVYTSQSSLNYHQKTAKFCLELRHKQTNQTECFICIYCKKEFTIKQSYNSHISNCKEKFTYNENELKKDILNKDLLIRNYEKQITELTLKLEFEQSTNYKLEKEIQELKQIVSRPTTTTTNIYNDNSTKTNYNIQFNQMVDKIGILCDKNILKRIRDIPEEEIDKYNFSDINTEVSNSLSNVLKDLAFCTDTSRKTVVTKNENKESTKMEVDEFLTICLQIGKPELNNYLDNIKINIDDKVNNDILSEEEFNIFKPKYVELRNFINEEKVNIKSSKNPLKKMTNMVMNKIEQLHKLPNLIKE
jgi:hypothetical protein